MKNAKAAPLFLGTSQAHKQISLVGNCDGQLKEYGAL